jgi:hypothetical protein
MAEDKKSTDLFFDTPDNGYVAIFEDEVYICDQDGIRVASWIKQEWIDDPSVLNSIVNAIAISLLSGTKKLKEMISKKDSK